MVKIKQILYDIRPNKCEQTRLSSSRPPNKISRVKGSVEQLLSFAILYTFETGLFTVGNKLKVILQCYYNYSIQTVHDIITEQPNCNVCITIAVSTLFMT